MRKLADGSDGGAYGSSRPLAQSWRQSNVIRQSDFRRPVGDQPAAMSFGSGSV